MGDCICKRIAELYSTCSTCGSYQSYMYKKKSEQSSGQKRNMKIFFWKTKVQKGQDFF